MPLRLSVANRTPLSLQSVADGALVSGADPIEQYTTLNLFSVRATLVVAIVARIKRLYDLEFQSFRHHF